MDSDIKTHLSYILNQFRTGRLTEEDIQHALELASDNTKTQSLLYIQTGATHPHSAVMGISIYEEGKDPDGIDEAGDMLYKSLKEAVDDGWRIIKFPEMVLAMDEQNTYGLGYEFILERWS